ncbi:MAG TPA: DUF3472 domain-containing protein [Candidatus Acidoferrum sp.]|nr:DUF3472 domain-containing protein [Candidatus Acidoferrum sp.]
MTKRGILLFCAGLMIAITIPSGHPAFATSQVDNSITHVQHFSIYTPDTDVQLLWPLNNSYSTSIDLKVINSPENNTSIFWGHMFSFMNTQQGYVGFGLGGDVKVATVAVFNALNGTTSNPAGGCDIGVPFSKTGTGWQCFILYNWKVGSDYTLQFSKWSTDTLGDNWWQATIYDYSNNSSTLIGNILTPTYYGLLGSASSTWDEYSTATTCNVLDTSVIFSSPYQMNTAGNHAPMKALVTYGNSTCTDSNVRYLGGGAYQADAGADVNRTLSKQTWLWTEEPPTISEAYNPIPEFSTINSITILIVTISFSSILGSLGTFSATDRRPRRK